jgi:hypothetical protein
MTTTTWDAPAWAHIQSLDPGLPRLLATLQATAAACEAAVPLAPSPAIDPFAGYPATRTVLVTLLLTLDLDAPPPLPDLDPPPDDDTAARVVDRLLRDTADQLLSLILELRDQLAAADYDQRAQLASAHGVPARALLRAVNTAMGDLAGAYLETFARPW